MNTIIEFLQFACRGYGTFIGVLILSALFLYYGVNGAIRLLSRFFRLLTVAIRGWPPPHLDADGDWKPEAKDD